MPEAITGVAIWDLPEAEDLSELIEETIVSSTVKPDLDTGTLTGVAAGACTVAGACIGKEVGALRKVETGV